MAATELFSTSLYSSPNLQAYWRFLQNDLTDSIGSVVITAGSGSTSISAGKFGYGRNQDGASDNSYFIIPYGADFATGSIKTLAFWIKVQETPSANGFIFDNSNISSGATHFIRITLTTSRTLTVTMNGASSSFAPTATQALTVGEWYHIAVTHNDSGGTMFVYVNGTATDAGVSVTQDIDTNSIPLNFGKLSDEHGGASDEPAFVIDDLAIFDTQLSQSQIRILVPLETLITDTVTITETTSAIRSLITSLLETISISENSTSFLGRWRNGAKSAVASFTNGVKNNATIASITKSANSIWDNLNKS